MSATKMKRRGAPTKQPGGLPRVLFVRIGADLLAALDALVVHARESRPGHSTSRADVVRDLLYRAVRP